ncbi:MAG: hypothetical protein WCW29_00075 [Candidatus Paceibacterota bacterium]
MKKLFFLIMVIAVLGMLNVGTTMTANGNKGSTSQKEQLFFDEPGLTHVSVSVIIDGTMVDQSWTGTISMINSQDYNAKVSDIEQGAKDISPQSCLMNMMTSDAQEMMYRSQWRTTGMMNQNQTTQMQVLETAQWRNSNLSGMMMNPIRPSILIGASTVLRIKPVTSKEEMTATGSMSMKLTAIDLEMLICNQNMQKVWPAVSSTNFAGAPMSMINAMQNIT